MASKKSSGMFSKRTLLPGSEKAAMVHPEAEDTTPPRLNPVTVSVIVKRKTPLKASHRSGKDRLTRAQYRKEHGADPAAVKLVKAFARNFGLKVDPDSPGPERRTILLTGSVDQMQKAFGATLSHKKVDGVTYRVREGGIEIPSELAGSVLAVLGLDNRPQAKPHFRIAGEEGAAAANAAQNGGFARPHASGSTSYTPIQVAELYQFPAKASAAGQTIAIIELGGGYKKADITAYFKSLGVKAPRVTAVLVDKAKNKPTNANSADGEVMLDIEVAGAVAPGANIVVYFTPNTDQGFVDAISTAVHDTKNNPSVISISWGAPEVDWTAQSINALDAACQSAAALGITITVASGDSGSTDGVTDGANHVDFPASSPHVLACGGTNLQGSGSTITSETVWNALPSGGASGGGVSNVFPLPSWQSGVGVPAPSVAAGGRGVPDVAGDADPATGYQVRVDGANYVFGGTSAVAPLWAGLIALANEQNGTSAGFIQPALYSAKGKGAFNDITEGNNPAFKAGPGWDGCTGLGSPIASQIISLINPKPASGKNGSSSKKATKSAKKSAKKSTARK